MIITVAIKPVDEEPGKSEVMVGVTGARNELQILAFEAVAGDNRIGKKAIGVMRHPRRRIDVLQYYIEQIDLSEVPDVRRVLSDATAQAMAATA